MNAKAHLATYPERMDVYKGVVQPRGKRHELPWSLELVNMFLSCCQQCRRCILPVGIYVDLRNDPVHLRRHAIGWRTLHKPGAAVTFRRLNCDHSIPEPSWRHKYI